MKQEYSKSIQVNGQTSEELESEFAAVLTQEALEFVAGLQRRFNPLREKLLERRKIFQTQIEEGSNPDFLKETREIRNRKWQITGTPPDLQDRRVEITGPVDRKMIINALNSGAQMFMADFEDSHSPTWEGTIQGQINLRDAIRKSISFESTEGKRYSLNQQTATLLVRPRGWHLVEKHVLVDGAPISASLFDFGIYFFHNAKELISRGTGPYFYLPKMENHLEARLWNEVFIHAQKTLGIPNATIKATVLIETILAAFEMDEILYELRDHIVGLNCGRWDYIFSYIKKFKNRPEFVLPDRASVTMDQGFLKAYVQLLIQTCHKRGAHAMGGMAAQIPIKNNSEANDVALAKVRADKLREATLGHDGTWVAHPGLVPIAREIFDSVMKTPHQITRKHEEWRISAKDLLAPIPGKITEKGLRTNINVSLLYLESWLRGSGCVPIHNLMEDAATAEISRAQIWQWIRHPSGVLENGEKITASLVQNTINREYEELAETLKNDSERSDKLRIAKELMEQIVLKEEFAEFITLPAYGFIE